MSLQVDASDYATGGGLLQDRRPVCFSSHILTNTKRNYAQIEEEFPANVSCMDSPPPRRFQRMMLKMQNYQLTVRYKKEEELFVADTLSRAATSVHNDTTPTVKQEWEVFNAELAQMDLGANTVTVETMNQIREETSKDPVLAVLHKVVLSAWPLERKEVPEQIRVYWDSRGEITVDDGILYKSHQVIVPTFARPEMLRKINKALQGADTSIRRARESVYWSGMQAAIRQTC